MDDEIATLTVGFHADSEDIKHGLHEIAEESAHTAHAVEEHANKIEALGERVEGFVHRAVAALELFEAKHFLKESLQEWQMAEDSMIKLTATLTANGREVEKLSEEYKEFAEHIEETTTYTHIQVEGLLKTAETYGLTGEAAKKAASDAIGFAGATGGNAQAYIRFTAALDSGNIQLAQRFARMIPQLRGIKNEQEFVAKASQLVKTGWATTAAQANTSTGAMKQLSNSFAVLKEEGGKIVAESLKPFVDILKEGVELLRGTSDETKRMIVQVLAVAAGLLLLEPAIAVIGTLLGPALSLIGLLGPALGLLFNPITLVIAGIALISSAFIDWKGVAHDVIAYVTRQWDGLVEHFAPAFQGVKDALAAGDLELAFKIVVLQLTSDWQDFNVKFVEYWNATKDVFLEGWYSMKAGAVDIFEDMTTAMATKLVDFLASVERVFGQGSAAKLLGVKEFDAANAQAMKNELERGNLLDRKLRERRENEAREKRKEGRDADLEDAKKAAADAKAALEGAIDDAWQERFWSEFWGKEDKHAHPPDIKPKGKPELDVKLVPKFDAAEFRGSEAFARIAEFRENMRLQIEGNPTGETKKGPDANTPILEDIRDELQDRGTVGVAELG